MTTEFCAGPPPFRFGYLPPGMRPDLQQLDPEREGKELYDPVFFLRGVGETRLHLYHGNSWRLTPISKRELTVLDGPGALAFSRMAMCSLSSESAQRDRHATGGGSPETRCRKRSSCVSSNNCKSNSDFAGGSGSYESFELARATAAPPPTRITIAVTPRSERRVAACRQLCSPSYLPERTML